MRTVALVAKTTLEHDGVTVASGQVFRAAPEVAAALVYQRKASADRMAIRVAELAAQLVAADQPKRRRYRRRDMTAQTA